MDHNSSAASGRLFHACGWVPFYAAENVLFIFAIFNN
jgi:hypothetical protein